MKILLIDAINFLISDIDYIGLALPSIASYVRSMIEDVDIKIINKDIDGVLNEFKPDLVGISSVTACFNELIKIAKQCKEYGLPVIIGGHHISALPLNLPLEIDIGIIGEGEITFSEICMIIKEYGWDFERIKNVKGIVYRDQNNTIQITESRPLIEDLDSIPFAARDLLSTFEQKEPLVFSSRGCPYRCVFCSPSRFWKKVRFNSEEYVIREIEYLIKEYETKFIYFADDLLISNLERFEKIVHLIDERGLNRKVGFKIPCRANLVNSYLIKLLKLMNVTEVHFGLESMNEKTLHYLKGENVDVNDNKTAVKLLNEADIKIVANFVIGSPDETREELTETLNFVEDADIYDYRCYILSALPGTPLWDYAMKENLVSEDISMDWSLCWPRSIDDNTIIFSKHISREELKAIFNKYSQGKNEVS